MSLHEHGLSFRHCASLNRSSEVFKPAPFPIQPGSTYLDLRGESQYCSQYPNREIHRETWAARSHDGHLSCPSSFMKVSFTFLKCQSKRSVTHGAQEGDGTGWERLPWLVQEKREKNLSISAHATSQPRGSRDPLPGHRRYCHTSEQGCHQALAEGRTIWDTHTPPVILSGIRINQATSTPLMRPEQRVT